MKTWLGLAHKDFICVRMCVQGQDPPVEVDVQHGGVLPASQDERLVEASEALAVHAAAPLAEGAAQQLVQRLCQLPVGQARLLAAARRRQEVGLLHRLVVEEGDAGGEEERGGVRCLRAR